MPRHGVPWSWDAIFVVTWCYFASCVTGQCVMVDQVGFRGSDNGASIIGGIANFDDCKEYCLAKDDCAAVEYRFPSFCTEWTDTAPPILDDVTQIIALKECSADVATSSPINLQPSETSLSMQITSTLSSTLSSISSTATVICAHGVTEITEVVDYLELDGGLTIPDPIFTEQGWESPTPGGGTLTISFTGNGEKILQQLSFTIKNGNGTQVSVVIETSPGEFGEQDFIDVGSDEQLYVRNFNTPFVSIAISTTDIISSLVLKVCNENPGDGATTSTPDLQTRIIATTTTPAMPSTSEISTSSDRISPTSTTIVSGLDSSSPPRISTQSTTSVIGLIKPGSITFVFSIPTTSFTSSLISSPVQPTSSPEATTTAGGLVQSGSTTFVFSLPTPSLTSESTSSSVSISLSPQPASTRVQVIQPSITRVNGTSDAPDQDSVPSFASSELSTEVIALSATGAFIVVAFIVAFGVVIFMARRPWRTSAQKDNQLSKSSSTQNGMRDDLAMTRQSKMVYPEYKTYFIPPKHPYHLYHIPRPMVKV